MTDLRELLDAEADRVLGRPDVLSHVLRRVERRRRGRRIGTAALALLIAAGGMVGAYSAFGRPGSEAGPGAGYRGVWPQTSLEEAEIAQSRVDAGDLSLKHQLDATLFLQAFARDGLFWTDVAFDRIEDEAAQGSGPLMVSVSGCPFDASAQPQPERSPSSTHSEDCPLEAAVTIERLLRRDPTGIWAVTEVTVNGSTPDVHRSPLPPIDPPGSGLDPFAPKAVRTLAWGFIEARSESRAVAKYLSAGAMRDYEDAEGGLSLYGYAGEAHTQTLWAITEAPEGWRVVIGFQGPEPTFPGGEVIRETLLIGPGTNLLDETVDWVVLDAEPCLDPSRCGGE